MDANTVTRDWAMTGTDILRYRAQMQRAQNDSNRRRNARANGYRGPLTRADLAARCERMQRDNA